MLNLVKTQQFNVKVESTSFSDAPISASTWDFSNDSLICAFGPSEGEGIVELIRLTVWFKTTSILLKIR
jgi:elongator complex protein 1